MVLLRSGVPTGDPVTKLPTSTLLYCTLYILLRSEAHSVQRDDAWC